MAKAKFTTLETVIIDEGIELALEDKLQIGRELSTLYNMSHNYYPRKIELYMGKEQEKMFINIYHISFRADLLMAINNYLQRQQKENVKQEQDNGAKAKKRVGKSL